MDPLTNLIVATLILGSPWILRAIVIRRNRIMGARERLRQVREMPIEAARAELVLLLAGKSSFEFSPVSEGWLARLRPKVPVGVFDVWTQYGAPTYRADRLARIAPHVMEPADKQTSALLAQYGAHPEIRRIGYCGLTSILYASPESEVLYEVLLEPDIPEEYRTVKQHPSVYHWMLSLVPSPGELLLRPAIPQEPSSLMRPAHGDTAGPDFLLRPDGDDP